MCASRIWNPTKRVAKKAVWVRGGGVHMRLEWRRMRGGGLEREEVGFAENMDP